MENIHMATTVVENSKMLAKSAVGLYNWGLKGYGMTIISDGRAK